MFGDHYAAPKPVPLLSRLRPSLGALVASAIGLATLAIAVLASRGRLQLGSGSAAPSKGDERERLLGFLKELSRRFFHVCRDVAGVAQTVRPKIASKQIVISEEKLCEQLTRQCLVFDKLKEITAEVAAQFETTPEAVQKQQERACRRAGGDPEVQTYVAGLKQMLDDSLQGLLPILPGVKIPAALTEDAVLYLQGEAQKLELQLVLEKVGGSRLALKDLGAALIESNKEAWRRILEDGSSASFLDGGPELFHSAVAEYMRKPAFAEERQKLEDSHKQKMVSLFRPEQGATPVPAA